MIPLVLRWIIRGVGKKNGDGNGVIVIDTNKLIVSLYMARSYKLIRTRGFVQVCERNIHRIWLWTFESYHESYHLMKAAF